MTLSIYLISYAGIWTEEAVSVVLGTNPGLLSQGDCTKESYQAQFQASNLWSTGRWTNGFWEIENMDSIEQRWHRNE